MATTSIAMSSCPNDAAPPAPSPATVVLVGPRCGPRWRAFRTATLKTLGAPPREFGYQDLLEAPERLAEGLRPGDVLRLDAPDRDPSAIRALYRLGRTAAEQAGFSPMSDTELEAAMARPGALGSPSQLAFGLEAAARRVSAAAAATGAAATATAEDVALAYDKTACLAQLGRLGLPHPRALGGAEGFDAAVGAMRVAGVGRAFIKLRHGAAAAGMVALAMSPRGVLAHATAELGGDGRLYATRRVRRLTRLDEIRAIVDAMAPLGLHLEAWAPKAGVDGQTCDLRVVVLEGEEVFETLRLSAGPMTNLRLGARRAEAAALRDRMAPEAWAAILQTARTAARGFPGLRSVGLDIAPLVGLRGHVALEVNAFGDFVKGAERDGRSPQERLLLRLLGRAAPAPRRLAG